MYAEKLLHLILSSVGASSTLTLTFKAGVSQLRRHPAKSESELDLVVQVKGVAREI